MPFDSAPPLKPAGASRRRRGRRSYHAGLMAEDTVARNYEESGARIVERRWRGLGGEIDLVVEDGESHVFVEVKQSRDFDRAALAVSPAQVDRIMIAASEYVGTLPTGQLTPMRFDLALVNCRGEMQILKNAFGF